MKDDDAHEQLRKSVITAFDKWGANWFDALFSKKKEGLTEEDWDMFRYDDLFMSKRALIPGFMRYVTQQVNQNEDSQRQRKTLLKACLISTLDIEGTTVKELIDSTSEPAYDRRQIQRMIHERYPEIFIDAEKQKDDLRFEYFSTVFTPEKFPHLQNPEEVFKAQLNDQIIIDSNPKHYKRFFVNGAVENVTPENLESLLRFREEALQLIREIPSNTLYKKILTEDLKQVTDVLLIFHAHFKSMLAVSWFRGRRIEAKKELMERGFPLKYSSNDAEKARNLLLTLSTDENVASVFLQYGAYAFNELELPAASIILYNECLKLTSISDLLRGVIHENISIQFRNSRNSKLMVTEMKKALEYYQKSRNDYRVCVALKNLGEAEWALGYRDAAKKYFNEADEMSERLSIPEKAGVHWNLAMAARRLREKQMEITYLVKCMNEFVEPEKILIINRRLSELTDNY